MTSAVVETQAADGAQNTREELEDLHAHRRTNRSLKVIIAFFLNSDECQMRSGVTFHAGFVWEWVFGGIIVSSGRYRNVLVRLLPLIKERVCYLVLKYIKI